MAAAVFESREQPWPVVGVTVDHGLHDDSAEVASHVVGQMATLGADETASIRVSVEADGQGLEGAARHARYAVLEEIADRYGSATVLLGHTLDDQAETVLLGLTRGSGGRSLAGMRRSFGVFRRPLLDLSRAQTEQACRAQGITWWSDPANDDPRFARSRVRNTVLPVLEKELGPGVSGALARTADLLRADVGLLDELAESAYAALQRPLAVTALQALAPAIRRRVLRLAALDAGARDAELFHEHVLGLDALLTDWHGQGPVDLPGHVRGVRRDGALEFEHR
jgi:tRNA(Ile)-lysidine synthase